VGVVEMPQSTILQVVEAVLAACVKVHLSLLPLEFQTQLPLAAEVVVVMVQTLYSRQ
jgi:hypothetical protein